MGRGSWPWAVNRTFLPGADRCRFVQQGCSLCRSDSGHKTAPFWRMHALTLVTYVASPCQPLCLCDGTLDWLGRDGELECDHENPLDKRPDRHPLDQAEGGAVCGNGRGAQPAGNKDDSQAGERVAPVGT